MEAGVVSILDLKPGNKGRVQGILKERENRCEGGLRCRHRHRHGHGSPFRGKGCGGRLLEMLGLYRGQTVEVVENRGWGPVILKVGDTKFVLGRGQAARILVQPLYEEGRS